jgi:hypothetical protein
VVLNYCPGKTVDFALQVRVAQIDRIKAQLPQQIALVDRRKLKLDRFTHILHQYRSISTIVDLRVPTRGYTTNL